MLKKLKKLGDKRPPLNLVRKICFCVSSFCLFFILLPVLAYGENIDSKLRVSYSAEISRDSSLLKVQVITIAIASLASLFGSAVYGMVIQNSAKESVRSLSSFVFIGICCGAVVGGMLFHMAVLRLGLSPDLYLLMFCGGIVGFFSTMVTKFMADNFTIMAKAVFSRFFPGVKDKGDK